MSRKTLISLLVVIASALLAVALFIAGAVWRGRMSHTTYKTSSQIPPPNCQHGANIPAMAKMTDHGQTGE